MLTDDMRSLVEARLEIEISHDLLSLRKVSSLIWSDMAAKANCTILSTISSEYCDAYLLTNASLFVFDHRVIMLKSGDSSLKEAALAFLELVSPAEVNMLWYQRRRASLSEKLPEFRAEVVSLWLALNADIDRTVFLDDRHEVCTFLYRGPNCTATTQYVLQIVMAELGTSVCESFLRGLANPDLTYEQTDILKLVNGFDVDARFIDPPGFSMNAILGDKYFAVHVSADPARSFASLETNNLFEKGWSELITKVLVLFRPGKFSCFLVEPESKRSEIEMPYRIEERTSCTILECQRVKLLAYSRKKPNFL